MCTLLEKGNFENLNLNFINDAIEALKPLLKIQKKYNKFDNDSIFNELKDSMVANSLGFDLINNSKHGFDAKNSKTEDVLEVKQTAISSTAWNVTFNDTTLEKANVFKSDKVFIAVGVWGDFSNLLFIVYGNNPSIGEFLEKKAKSFRKNGNIRSAQTITVKKLVQEYQFKIKPINATKEEIQQLFSIKWNGKKDWWSKAIDDK